MIIDTHAHLYYEGLIENVEVIVESAVSAGVEKIFVPAVDLKTSDTILELTAKFKNVYAILGFHPCDIAEVTEKDFQFMEEMMNEKKVIGIGETGLDYYWDVSYKEKQKDFFKRHLEISNKKNLPVVIHTRDSIKDAIKVIKEFNKVCKGQFHCFSGDEEDLKEVMGFGTYYVSFCGNITYKNFDSLDLVKKTPVDRLLAETDSPFLTPVPHRGKKNQPSYVIHTINKIAELKKYSPDDLISKLKKNTTELFPEAF